MQRDTKEILTVFVHQTFCESSVTSPAIVLRVVPTSIPSMLNQTKRVDIEIEDKESGQLLAEKSFHKEHSIKNFSTSPKNLEEQVSRLSDSLTISTSAVSINENPVENTPKNKDGFIFYKCRFCGLTYNYLTTLRAHERIHDIDEVCNYFKRFRIIKKILSVLFWKSF